MTTAAYHPTRLQQRIAALRDELAAAEAKRQRIAHAIALKRETLSRLEAQAVLRRPVAPTRPDDECP